MKILWNESKGILIYEIIFFTGFFFGCLLNPFGKVVFFIIFLLLIGFTIYSFRCPEIKIKAGRDEILSPADGKIMEIREVDEEEYIKGKAIRIWIFIRPIDAHCNRAPCNGKVELIKRINGEFHPAFNFSALEKNNQVLIGIETTHGKMLIKQITGFIARRIVTYVKEGEKIRAGDLIGLIKFGSAVVIYLPKGKFNIKVKENEIVKAGETIIAKRSRK